MKIIINGALGAMGRNVAKLCGSEERVIAAKIDRSYHTDERGECEYASLDDFTGEADVLIDFTNHLATSAVLGYSLKRGIACVIGTTGQTDEEKAAIYEAARCIPVFFAANMSVGVAVLTDLVQKAAESMPGTEVEIIEIHHNRKLDVPSGTALVLANAVKKVREDSVFNIGRPNNGKRTKEEIGIHSLRLGDVTGTHEVIFTNGMETVTLKHEAHDRALFAEGALRAAEWIIGKEPGLYGMKDMIG